MCGITCPIIKFLFHEHTLNYAEVVKDCTIMSDLRGKRKLHIRIQMLITARSLEGTIINYILYILAPHEEVICLEEIPFPCTIVHRSYNM